MVLNIWFIPLMIIRGLLLILFGILYGLFWLLTFGFCCRRCPGRGRNVANIEQEVEEAKKANTEKAKQAMVKKLGQQESEKRLLL